MTSQEVKLLFAEPMLAPAVGMNDCPPSSVQYGSATRERDPLRAVTPTVQSQHIKQAIFGKLSVNYAFTNPRRNSLLEDLFENHDICHL